MTKFRVGLFNLVTALVVGVFFIIPAAVKAEETLRAYPQNFPGATGMLWIVVIMYFLFSFAYAGLVLSAGVVAMKQGHSHLTQLQQALIWRDLALLPLGLGLVLMLLGHSLAGPLFTLMGSVSFLMCRWRVKDERNKAG